MSAHEEQVCSSSLTGTNKPFLRKNKQKKWQLAIANIDTELFREAVGKKVQRLEYMRQRETGKD